MSEAARRGPLLPAFLTVLLLVQAGTLLAVMELGSREPARSGPRGPEVAHATGPAGGAAIAAAPSAAGIPPELAEELRAIRAELARLRAELPARPTSEGPAATGTPPARVGPVSGLTVSAKVEAAERIRAFQEANLALYGMALSEEERRAEIQTRGADLLGLSAPQRVRLGEILARLKQETVGPAHEIEVLFERTRERKAALRQAYAKDRRSKRLDAEAEALARSLHAEYHRLRGQLEAARKGARDGLRELVGPVTDPLVLRFLDHGAARWLSEFDAPAYGLSWGEGVDVESYLPQGVAWVRDFREEEEEER